MRVIKAYPPNYPAIRRAFPHIRGQSIIFAYGDRIFYPAGGKLEPWLLAHEGVHGRRQGNDPAGWWDRYLSDPAFRLDEEILAHREEYRSGGDLDFMARRLSSPLYGSGLSMERARELITGR